jgi:hypothetical protein
MDCDKMNNRNRGLSIDASYQVSVYLAEIWWKAPMEGSVLRFLIAE